MNNGVQDVLGRRNYQCVDMAYQFESVVPVRGTGLTWDASVPVVHTK